MTSTAHEQATDRSWSFVTAHALALIELSREPDLTIRTLAGRLDLTERHTHRILCDLVDGGYITRTRIGRRNRYEIHPSREMRTPALAQREIGSLLEALAA